MLWPGCSRCRVSGVPQLLSFPKSCTASPEFWGPALTFQPAPCLLKQPQLSLATGSPAEGASQAERPRLLERWARGVKAGGRRARQPNSASEFRGLAVFLPAAARPRGRGGGVSGRRDAPGPRIQPRPAPRAQRSRGGAGPGARGPPREARAPPGVRGGAAPDHSAAQDGGGVGRASPRPPLGAPLARPARGRAPPARGWAASVSAEDGREPWSAGGWGRRAGGLRAARAAGSAPHPDSGGAPDALGPLPAPPSPRGPGTASAEWRLLGSVPIPSNCRSGDLPASPSNSCRCTGGLRGCAVPRSLVATTTCGH